MHMEAGSAASLPSVQKGELVSGVISTVFPTEQLLG